MNAGPATGRAVTLPRWLVILFAAGVALDILVGTALGLVAVQARSASSSAHIARVAGYQTCLANNDFRALDLSRWNAIIVLLRSDGSSPELRAFVAGVEKANLTADAPRDCHLLMP